MKTLATKKKKPKTKPKSSFNAIRNRISDEITCTFDQPLVQVQPEYSLLCPLHEWGAGDLFLVCPVCIQPQRGSVFDTVISIQRKPLSFMLRLIRGQTEQRGGARRGSGEVTRVAELFFYSFNMSREAFFISRERLRIRLLHRGR